MLYAYIWYSYVTCKITFITRYFAASIVSLQSCVYNTGQCQVRLLEVKAAATARRRSQ